MKTIFKCLKPLLKLLTSSDLVELFDKDGDEKVSWKELWQGLKDPEILGELAMKVGGVVGTILLLK